MISIVMAYYQRQGLLDKTIESINRSAVKDFELIIVDDASETPVVCDRAKVIRIEPQNKWWHNPCIPFNMGFKEAMGDVVIIQNPECYHKGDILAYIEENIKENTYLSFGCYALNNIQTQLLHTTANEIIIEGRRYRHPENNGWYNHSVYRPLGYHFCSAMRKQDLNRLGGFDKRYAHGISFDDADFIRRIRRSMHVEIVNNPYVLHQYHMPFTYKKPNYKRLHTINKKIFHGQDMYCNALF